MSYALSIVRQIQLCHPLCNIHHVFLLFLPRYYSIDIAAPAIYGLSTDGVLALNILQSSEVPPARVWGGPQPPIVPEPLPETLSTSWSGYLCFMLGIWKTLFAVDCLFIALVVPYVYIVRRLTSTQHCSAPFLQYFRFQTPVQIAPRFFALLRPCSRLSSALSIVLL